jgi:pyrroloquinoline quinone biosynthesis protein B
VRLFLPFCFGLLAAFFALGSAPLEPSPTPPFVVVLGTAQDAGHPQADCAKDCCSEAWSSETKRHRVASLGIVDPETGQRWLIDASPDFPDQLRHLDQLQPAASDLPLDGVFLTHAHMGHYTGLLHLGREAMGAEGVAVHAMPRMNAFLRANGPWSQLVGLKKIRLNELAAGTPVPLGKRLQITPFLVPHRDEFSETVGFVVRGPSKSIAWLPDIDKWERWDVPIEDLIHSVDRAYLDGTFYADGEIPRDMAEVPHPFIQESMKRLAPLSRALRNRVRFVHLNHTNPALDPTSSATQAIDEAGFGVARWGERSSL